MLTAFWVTKNQLSLPETTCFFKAVRIIHMKLLVEQGWLIGVNVPFQHKYGYIRDQSLNRDFFTNSHLAKRRLKRLTNFEYAENVQSSNVIECECKRRHIPRFDLTATLCLLRLLIYAVHLDHSGVT